jgi:hypothetical protein
MITYNDKTRNIRRKMEKENTTEWESVAVALRTAGVKAGQMWKVDGHVLEAQRVKIGRLRLKCDGTRTETRFGLSAKRTSPFKLAGASVQSTTGS